MCNGVRCTAKFAVDNNLVNTENLIVKAPVGDIKAFVENDDVKVIRKEMEMILDGK